MVMSGMPGPYRAPQARDSPYSWGYAATGDGFPCELFEPAWRAPRARMAQVWLVHQLRWDRMVSRPGTCWRPSAVGSIVTLP